MWKPKLYIGASLFDSILSDNKEMKEISLEVFKRCRNQVQYEGFISPFTIFELQKRYTRDELKVVIDLINENSIWLINYKLPKEIDHLVGYYKNAEVLPERVHFDYYHLATCSYLNIEFYLCWNKKDIINFKTFRKILHSHIPRGYRSNIQLESPEYFTEQESKDIFANIIDASLLNKRACLHEINNFPPDQRALFTQQQIAGISELISNIIILPNHRHLPARIPLLDLTDVELKFEVTNFEQEIRNGTLPLFDMNYDVTHFEMDYHMFKLETIQGQVLLKNKQLELIYHLPVEYTESELYNIKKERVSSFINWLLPQIRCSIDNSKEEFKQIKPETITSYSFDEIDHRLAASITSNSVKTGRYKAIELTDLLTETIWQDYQGFSFYGEWCKFNSNFENEANITHIIIQKQAEKIWVILMNPIIP